MVPPAAKESEMGEAGYVTPPVMFVVVNGTLLYIVPLKKYPPDVEVMER